MDIFNNMFQEALTLSKQEECDFGNEKVMEAEEDYKNLSVHNNEEVKDIRVELSNLKKKLKATKNVKNVKKSEINKQNAIKRAELRKEIQNILDRDDKK